MKIIAPPAIIIKTAQAAVAALPIELFPVSGRVPSAFGVVLLDVEAEDDEVDEAVAVSVVVVDDADVVVVVVVAEVVVVVVVTEGASSVFLP